MRKTTLALAAMLASLLLVVLQLPAQAYIFVNGVKYSEPSWHSDCSGNGCLSVKIRYRLADGVGNIDHGFYLGDVQISTDGGGLFYQGAAGHGVSCWNDANTVVWSSGNDDLNDGASRTFNTDKALPNTRTVTCGWHFTDVFVPGSDVNQCAKLKFFHDGDIVKGNCG